jgi:hypothetical protein
MNYAAARFGKIRKSKADCHSIHATAGKLLAKTSSGNRGSQLSLTYEFLRRPDLALKDLQVKLRRFS